MVIQPGFIARQYSDAMGRASRELINDRQARQIKADALRKMKDGSAHWIDRRTFLISDTCVLPGVRLLAPVNDA
jgi:hypothetical protein